MMRIENIVEKKLQEVFNDNQITFDKSRFAGGLTNHNYIMNIHGFEYVVRQPGCMTDQMIDRRIEKVNNEIASNLGLNSKCIYFDDETGIKFSAYIPESMNIAQDSPENPKNIQEVAILIKKIHSSEQVFENDFDFKKELQKYEEIVRTLNGDFFFDYEWLKNDLYKVYGEYAEKNIVKVPCHNDTVPENFVIDKEGRTYLIDWEYAGMNDHNWDVAAYILESRLSENAIDCLFNEYYGSLPSQEEIRKLKLYILAQDLLWTVWALIRHYGGDDFLEYCTIRYERFRKNMSFINCLDDHSIYELVCN